MDPVRFGIDITSVGPVGEKHYDDWIFQLATELWDDSSGEKWQDSLDFLPFLTRLREAFEPCRDRGTWYSTVALSTIGQLLESDLIEIPHHGPGGPRAEMAKRVYVIVHALKAALFIASGMQNADPPLVPNDEELQAERYQQQRRRVFEVHFLAPEPPAAANEGDA